MPAATAGVSDFSTLQSEPIVFDGFALRSEIAPAGPDIWIAYQLEDDGGREFVQWIRRPSEPEPTQVCSFTPQRETLRGLEVGALEGGPAFVLLWEDRDFARRDTLHRVEGGVGQECDMGEHNAHEIIAQSQLFNLGGDLFLVSVVNHAAPALLVERVLPSGEVIPAEPLPIPGIGAAAAEAIFEIDVTTGPSGEWLFAMSTGLVAPGRLVLGQVSGEEIATTTLQQLDAEIITLPRICLAPDDAIAIAYSWGPQVHHRLPQDHRLALGIIEGHSVEGITLVPGPSRHWSSTIEEDFYRLDELVIVSDENGVTLVCSALVPNRGEMHGLYVVEWNGASEEYRQVNSGIMNCFTEIAATASPADGSIHIVTVDSDLDATGRRWSTVTMTAIAELVP